MCELSLNKLHGLEFTPLRYQWLRCGCSARVFSIFFPVKLTMFQSYGAKQWNPCACAKWKNKTIRSCWSHIHCKDQISFTFVNATQRTFVEHQTLMPIRRPTDRLVQHFKYIISFWIEFTSFRRCVGCGSCARGCMRRRSKNVEECQWCLDAVSSYWMKKSNKSEKRKKKLHFKINLRFDCGAVGQMPILTAHQLQHFQSIVSQSPQSQENGKLNSGDKTNQADRIRFDDDRSTTCATKRQKAKKKSSHTISTRPLNHMSTSANSFAAFKRCRWSVHAICKRIIFSNIRWRRRSKRESSTVKP